MSPSKDIWRGTKTLIWERKQKEKNTKALYITKVNMKKKTVTVSFNPPFKIKQQTWYGFDHKKVAEQFEGDLTFCAEFCVRDEYLPVAVYKAKKPNTKKGHKKYVLLHKPNTDYVIVRGMSAQEMAKERYQRAVLCLSCNTVLYSINRHHYHGCGCKEDIHVDGGKEYLKISGWPGKYEIVTLDLITGKLKK